MPPAKIKPNNMAEVSTKAMLGDGKLRPFRFTMQPLGFVVIIHAGSKKQALHILESFWCCA